MAMFAISGGIFALAIGLFVAAAKLAQDHEKRAAVYSFVAGAAMAVVATAFLWLGSMNPTFNFLNNQGFGPGWSCLNFGAASAQVCGREENPAQKKKGREPWSLIAPKHLR